MTARSTWRTVSGKDPDIRVGTRMRRARKDVTVPISTSPTDGSGTYSGYIYPFEIDSDNERLENFVNLPSTLPAVYMHTYGDKGAIIGEVLVTHEKAKNRLKISGKLFLKDNPMAVAVYERMLLPDDAELALRAFSIGFAYATSKAYKGDDGETVIVDAELLEVSVVSAGAQRTELVSVKNRDKLRRLVYDLDPASVDSLLHVLAHDELSVKSMLVRLERISPESESEMLANFGRTKRSRDIAGRLAGPNTARDEFLRREIDTVDNIPTRADSVERFKHPDSTIRALAEKLDKLAEPVPTPAVNRQAERDREEREAGAERARLRLGLRR